MGKKPLGEDHALPPIHLPEIKRRFRRKVTRKKALPVVDVQVRQLQGDHVVTCKKCGHDVHCKGLSRRKVRAACQLLRETCPNWQENNYYKPEDGNQ
jgi:hypothetical protein